MDRQPRTILIGVLALVQLGCSDDTPPFTNGDATTGCQVNATRCQGGNLEVCKPDANGTSWQADTSCLTGCQVVNGTASCAEPETCLDSKKNQNETDVDCGGSCPACTDGKGCKADGDCKSKACTGGVCKQCKAGGGSCLGNLVRKCNTDEASFTTIATCDPVKGELCNATDQKCQPSKVIGTAKPTGTYYLFAMFKTGSSDFKGGYDVDSYVTAVGDSGENLIYVNRNKQLDVYKVELLDSDGDKKLEPNQHPDNPKEKGAIEARKLTFIKTYTNVTLGQPSVGELYAEKDRVSFIRNDTASNVFNIYEFIFATGATNLIAAGNPKLPLCMIGYDEINKRWYGAYNAPTRRIYGFYEQGGWAIEFDYPNLAGDHTDGLEVVVDPKTHIPYVYVSDMTSDFLAQYYQDPATGQWAQKNVFQYKESSNAVVEGMGFGAFQHFWMASGSALYEVGGGDLQQYVGID